MNGAFRKLLLVVRFAFLRMLREPASTIIMIGIPLPLIPILGAIFSNIPYDGAYLKGSRNMMSFVATGMIVMFQLFSGKFSMDGVRDSLISERRWRIHAAPCAPGVHVMGILAAGTVLSLLQGALLVAFSRLALDVRWGSFGVVVLVLLAVSLLSQLVNVTLLLAIRTYAVAATLSWVFAWGSAALGGLVFPLPTDRPFWRFMVTYGTPYSLGQTAVINSARGSRADVALCIGALAALSALFTLVAVLLRRRRLA